MREPLSFVVLPPASDVPRAEHAMILLHGYGANAQDLLPLRDVIAPSWTAIAFEAPVDLGPMGMPGGRAWFHLSPDPSGGIAYDLEGAMEAVASLANTIPQALDQVNLNIDQSVVLGFSQGAMLGHGLVLHQQLQLRGLAACSGRLVPELFAHGQDVPESFPVFLSHGTLDELIPVTSGQAIRQFYDSETKADVTWCEEPIGHGIGPQAVSMLQTWFGQR